MTPWLYWIGAGLSAVAGMLIDHEPGGACGVAAMWFAISAVVAKGPWL